MYIEIIVVKKPTGYDEIPGKLFTKALGELSAHGVYPSM